MFLLTLRDNKDEGAYAVQNRYGEKVLFLFEDEDDAERYAMHLHEDEEAVDFFSDLLQFSNSCKSEPQEWNGQR